MDNLDCLRITWTVYELPGLFMFITGLFIFIPGLFIFITGLFKEYWAVYIYY